MTEIREGDLYKSFTVFGVEFSLYYGYYDDKEKNSRYGELMPIYPDFRREPTYLPDGRPLVTEMQDVCTHYVGRADGETCYGCRHFVKGEELIGLCSCEQRRVGRNNEPLY